MYVSFQIRNAVIGYLDALAYHGQMLLQLIGALHQVVVLADLLLQLFQPVGDQGGAFPVGQIAADQRPRKTQQRHNDGFRHVVTSSHPYTPGSHTLLSQVLRHVLPPCVTLSPVM